MVFAVCLLLFRISTLLDQQENKFPKSFLNAPWINCRCLPLPLERNLKQEPLSAKTPYLWKTLPRQTCQLPSLPNTKQSLVLSAQALRIEISFFFFSVVAQARTNRLPCSSWPDFFFLKKQFSQFTLYFYGHCFHGIVLLSAILDPALGHFSHHK